LTREILKAHDHLLEVDTTWYSPITAETGAVYTTFSAAADIAVVEVDVETGVTRILKYVHFHDAGKIVNQAAVKGQIYGGIMQGIGEALYEELLYDEKGHLLSNSYSDYMIPTIAETPFIEIGHMETPSPFTELGTKGMGEAPIIGSKAVILSAIEDALSPFDIVVDQSPATRERVRRWVLNSERTAKQNGTANT
jgi:CO/xanthine dehydrogenase Mo-binding subunit